MSPRTLRCSSKALRFLFSAVFSHSTASVMVKIVYISDTLSSAEQQQILQKREHCWRQLYDEGLVPRLERLCVLGAWTLTVAEWLDPSWRTLYRVLAEEIRGDAAKEALQDTVLRAVERMHALRIVHGDLRSHNIMVRGRGDGEWDVKFIDLGLEGEAKYPPLLNTTSVTRPDGAESDGLITAQQDKEQVDLEF